MTERMLRQRIDPFLNPASEQTAAGSGGATKASDTRPVAAILGEQAALAKEFDRLIAGKSRETLMQPDNDGGWGIVEIVSHLLDWEQVTHDRVHRILNEEHPHLPDFDDSLWAVEHHYRDNDPLAVLNDLREHRDALVAELEQLDEAEWQRPALLDGQGEITLHWLMNRVCDHDTKHLAQARGVLA
jgi:hypothetical protein